MMQWLDSIPCPAWVARELDASYRRLILVLQIWMLSDKTTTIAALWLARVSWLSGCSVDGSLQAIKEAMLR